MNEDLAITSPIFLLTDVVCFLYIYMRIFAWDTRKRNRNSISRGLLLWTL